MDKKQLIGIKKRLLALSLAGVMLGASGCSNNKNSDEQPSNDEQSSKVAISSEYSHPEEFYKYVVLNDQAVKVYNSSNVYLFFDKETYEASEYLFKYQFTLLGDEYGGELYDLESEELLFYSNGITTSDSFNREYYDNLMENNYSVPLSELSDYVEGCNIKDYYTLEEIRELEPQIVHGLKLINKEKAKIKK